MRRIEMQVTVRVVVDVDEDQTDTEKVIDGIGFDFYSHNPDDSNVVDAELHSHLVTDSRLK
jgi:hypothetical protein